MAKKLVDRIIDISRVKDRRLLFQRSQSMSHNMVLMIARKMISLIALSILLRRSGRLDMLQGVSTLGVKLTRKILARYDR